MAHDHKPEAQDFSAAESYFSLLTGPAAAAKMVKGLRKEETLLHLVAKDILRAAGLPLMGPDASEVTADLDKVPTALAVDTRPSGRPLASETVFAREGIGA